MIIENNDKINLNTLLNNYIIYIPDMQRDYCWGITKADKSENTLFKNFLDTLVQNSNENKTDFTMGLFYGYVEDRRIYLCDGQQRITSLYLILLYTCKLNKLNIDLLIHNNIPTLQYAVRDSSLFFLNDLVEHIKNIDVIIKIDDIKTMDWYFDEYNNDDTIQNIIAALKTLENESNRINNDKFISYILKEINFIFIDMKTRENGEETYVLLNTTGEPLTTVENLKPYLVFNNTDKMEKYAEIWEEIEHFFWIKTNQNYEMAEKCFMEFLRWVVKLTCYEKSVNILKEKDILYSFFTKEEKPAMEVIKEYFDNIYKEDINPLLNIMGIELQFNGEYLEDKKIYSLFAAIYGNINNIPKDSYFYKIFKNIINRENKGGIEKITSKNVVEFLINHESKDILETLEKDSFLKNDVEEHLKLAIYNMLNDKNNLLNLFKEAYSFNILNNRILLLIEATVYEIKPYENIDDKFKFLKDTIINNADIFMKKFKDNIKIFKSEIVEKIANNELIINMLTYDAPEYPVTNKISDIAGGFPESPHICIYGAENISKWFYNNKINYREQILFLNKLFTGTKSEKPSNEKWLDILNFPKILEYTKHRRFGFNNVFYARKNKKSDHEIKLYTIYLFHEFLKGKTINSYETKYDYKNNATIRIWDENIKDKDDHHNRYGGIICIEKIINDKTLVIDIYAKNEKEFILQAFFREQKIPQDYINKITQVINYDCQKIDDNNIYEETRYEYEIGQSYENIVALCDKILESIN